MDNEKTLNVVQAIARFNHLLGTDSTLPEERALAVSWLLHIVGDIHQPLHSTALFTMRRFRQGDAGANGIMIKGAEDLHEVWDGSLVIDVETLAEHSKLLEHLQSDTRTVHQAEVGAKTLDPVTWLYEATIWPVRSHITTSSWETTAANEAVYYPSKSWREQPYLPEVTLSDHYVARSKRVARRRILLAGYRLASLFRQLGF